MPAELSFEGLGVLAQKPVTLVFRESVEEGVHFVLPSGARIQAHTQNVTSATRNTVLGSPSGETICFVEHLLAAIACLRLDRLEIEVRGAEIPLLDGSARAWLDLLKDWQYKISEEIPAFSPVGLAVQDQLGRYIAVLPSAEFRLTYLFQSPIDSSQSWVTWSAAEPNALSRLLNARTFAPRVDNQMLGLVGKVLSYDHSGYDLELQEPSEPALHKLLDLVGDLSLCGANPLSFRAHILACKSGHQLNFELAKLIALHLTKP